MKRRENVRVFALKCLGGFLFFYFVCSAIGYAENVPIGEMVGASQPVISPSEYEPPVTVRNESEPNTVEEHQRILDGLEKLDLMAQEAADLSEQRDLRDEIIGGGGNRFEKAIDEFSSISKQINTVSKDSYSETQGEPVSRADFQAIRPGETVVDKNARKNDELLKTAFSPGFLAKGFFAMPGNLSGVFPKPGDIPTSLVETGARRLGDYLKDGYLTIRRRIGKDSFDKDLAEKIKLLKNLQAQESLEFPVAKKQDGYITVDSVEIGKELATVYYLMHPPTQLHPYLRYLLYTRHVSPEVMRWYLTTLEKVNAIYRQAKAGKGKIRYKGRIVDAYLPLPSEMGGEYELIFEQEPNRKGSIETKPFFEK